MSAFSPVFSLISKGSFYLDFMSILEVTKWPIWAEICCCYPTKYFIGWSFQKVTIEIALLGCFWPFLELLWKSPCRSKVCHFCRKNRRFRQTLKTRDFTRDFRHFSSWSLTTLTLGWNPSTSNFYSRTSCYTTWNNWFKL